MFHTQVSAITSNIILKFSRSRLKFYKHGIGIESVICNLHMSGLSFSRAKVAQNENLLIILLFCLLWLHSYNFHIEGVYVNTQPMSVMGTQFLSRINQCTMMGGYKRLGTRRGSAQSQKPPPLLPNEPRILYVRSLHWADSTMQQQSNCDTSPRQKTWFTILQNKISVMYTKLLSSKCSFGKNVLFLVRIQISNKR